MRLNEMGLNGGTIWDNKIKISKLHADRVSLFYAYYNGNVHSLNSEQILYDELCENGSECKVRYTIKHHNNT